MVLASGAFSALLKRHRSGKGQVVDSAMVDGASLLSKMMWSTRGREMVG